MNEECREFLRTLKGPLGVISVAGMYRSGKSYLLNRVLLNRSRGFDVGHTINACTKVSSFLARGELCMCEHTRRNLVHSDFPLSE